MSVVRGSIDFEGFGEYRFPSDAFSFELYPLRTQTGKSGPGEGQAGAAQGGVGDGDLAAVPFDDPHDDGEPQAVAARLAVAAGIEAGKRLEDSLSVSFADSRAVIVEMDDAIIAITLDNKLDPAIRMTKGVLDEVAKGSRQIFRFKTGMAGLLIQMVMQLVADGAVVDDRLVEQLVEKGFQAMDAELQLRPLAIEAGEGQEFGNEGFQFGHIDLQFLGVMSPVFQVVRILQQFQAEAEAGQRGPQFVGYGIGEFLVGDDQLLDPVGHGVEGRGDEGERRSFRNIDPDAEIAVAKARCGSTYFPQFPPIGNDPDERQETDNGGDGNPYGEVQKAGIGLEH